MPSNSQEAVNVLKTYDGQDEKASRLITRFFYGESVLAHGLKMKHRHSVQYNHSEEKIEMEY